MHFIDLQRQYQKYKLDIDAQIQTVLDEASFIMGPKVGELEAALAEFVGVKHAIGCSSGTDALVLALMAYGVGPGDEIITTPFTFISTAEAVALLGAKSVFADINADTYNIDPALIEAAITPNTKGIIPVDMLGQCADYDAINEIAQKNNLFVIEDGAQSLGAQYKGRMACSLADIGCTSFFPAKPFGCYGDGGMVFTNDDEKADLMRSIRVHGKGSDKYDNVRIGLNARLDSVQAAVMLGKLPHFVDEINARQKVAQYYTDSLQDVVETPVIEEHNLSVYAQYSIKVKDRAKLQSSLKEQGIPTAIYYPKPLHLQGAFSDLGYKKGDMPVSEAVSEVTVALPMHPFLTTDEQDTIVGHVKSAVN